MIPQPVKQLGRQVLEWLGYRIPDYKSQIHHGEVCMDNVELHGLVQAIDELSRPPEYVAEIGSYCGGSTVVIGRAARRRNSKAKVLAIDPFEFHEDRYQYNYEEKFDQNVKDWNLGENISKVKKASNDAARDWANPLDFLYIDGDHSYEAVVADIKNFVPHVRPGGLFAFHDFKPVGKDGVRQAVEELVIPVHEKLFIAGSLICFRKNG